MARKTIYVDNTLLSSLVCSTKAVVRHHLGFTVNGERAKLYAGKAGHAAVEHWLKGGTAEEALAIFEAQYGRWAGENMPLDSALSQANTTDVLRYWLEEHRPNELPLIVEPGFVEVGFQVPLGDETLDNGDPAFVFYGRYDLFGKKRTDGSLWVLDHKFTGRVDDDYLDGYTMDSQISGYVWAAQQTFGHEVEGAYVNAIQMFKNLPRELERKCYIHKVPYGDCRPLHVVSKCQPYSRTTEQLDEWLATALALARRYRALTEHVPSLADARRLAMEGTFNKECRWCYFKEWCEAGRPEWAQGMLEYEPWAPFKVAAKEEN